MQQTTNKQHAHQKIQYLPTHILRAKLREARIIIICLFIQGFPKVALKMIEQMVGSESEMKAAMDEALLYCDQQPD
jgi:hypothetical protein